MSAVPGGECVPEECDTVFDGRSNSPLLPVFRIAVFQKAIVHQGEMHAYILYR